ncbi:MAG: cysteine-rich small domain-containing protein [Oscillospiraceae bacterium]|jgi:Zn-finger protein
MGDHAAFFENRACEYYPCHSGIEAGSFNCLFCYCPLYTLGENCGGKYRYTPAGVKDCSACIFPHQKENYGAILEAFPKIAKLAEKKERGD